MKLILVTEYASYNAAFNAVERLEQTGRWYHNGPTAVGWILYELV
jgi:hypothetical protein